MKLLSHVESELDDVNIALFSPICGGGFLYGTKQGKLRVCSTYRGEYDDIDNCNVLGGTRRCHFDQSVDTAEDNDDDEDVDDEEDDEEDEDEDADIEDDHEDEDAEMTDAQEGQQVSR